MSRAVDLRLLNLVQQQSRNTLRAPLVSQTVKLHAEKIEGPK